MKKKSGKLKTKIISLKKIGNKKKTMEKNLKII
jgi:hypothetical protein